MNKKLFFPSLLLISALLFAPTLVFAETTPTPTGLPQNKNVFMREKELKIEARVTKAQERLEKMKANVTERVQKMQERRAGITQKHAENLEIRFNAHYTRLATLASKIQTRIDTLKTEGKDTTTAQSKLDSAKSSLETAKGLGQEAVSAFLAVDPDKYTEQKTEVTAAREKAQKAKQAFITALQNLKDVVKALQDLKTPEQ